MAEVFVCADGRLLDVGRVGDPVRRLPSARAARAL